MGRGAKNSIGGAICYDRSVAAATAFGGANANNAHASSSKKNGANVRGKNGKRAAKPKQPKKPRWSNAN